MGDETSIKARLGLDIVDWRANSKTAGEDVTKFTAKVTEGKAAIAAFEAKMREAGKATADQKKLLSDARSELTKYEQDLRKATEAKKRFDAADNPQSPSPVPPRPSPTVPGHGGHGAGGNDRMRGAELGHSARSVMDMLSAGQSPAQAAMMEVPRLLQAFGGGIGTIVGVGALAGIAEKLVEVRNEAKELRKALDALGAPMPAAGKASVEEVNARLKETLETSQKLEAAKSGFFHVLAGALANRLKNPMGNIVEAVAAQGDTDDANARSAEGEKDRLTHSLAMSEKAGIDLDKRSANGDDSAALDKIRLKGAQERQAIEERIASGELSRDTELVANSHARENLEIEIEQRRQDAAKNTLTLESQLLQIKRTGAEVEVRSAEARLSAARQALFNGPREGTEHAGNFGKVQEAEEALRIAQRTSDEHRDDLDIQEAVALVVKNSDARHIVALGMEEQKLQARLASPEYGGDEKRTMSAHLVDLQDQQHDAMRGYIGKANQAYLAKQSTGYGNGAAGHLQGIRDRQMVLGMETDANTAGTRQDGSPVFKNGFLGVQQTAEAASLKRQEDAILFSEQQQLDTAKARTKQMEDEEKGLTGLSKIEGIRAGYQERIAQAIHDQNQGLADELKKQQSVAEGEANLAEFLKPPAQKAQEARDETKRQQDIQRMNDGGHTHDADKNGSVIPLSRGSGIIPDNTGMGYGDIGSAHMPGPTHMPDRSFTPDPDAFGPNHPDPVNGLGADLYALPDIKKGARKLGRDGIPGFSADSPFDTPVPFDLHTGMPAPDAPDGNAPGFGLDAAAIHRPIVSALQDHGQMMHDLMTG